MAVSKMGVVHESEAAALSNDTAALAATRRPTTRANHLPGYIYTSPRSFGARRRKSFSGTGSALRGSKNSRRLGIT